MVGPFLLDVATGVVRRDGVPLTIGRRGVAIFDALVTAGGAPVSKQELLDRVWPGLEVGEANLSVQVAALRKELGRTRAGGEWITTVPRVGYRFAVDLIESASSLNRQPTLAVLPFKDLSPSGQQGYFADGLVEDIITGLSRFSTFAVVSPSASFAWRDRPSDPRTVAHVLGVRYLLTGSLQRQQDRLRVTVRLLDGDSGRQQWAEQFDGNIQDLFAFQDRVTEVVAGCVSPGILKAEIERVRRRPPEHPSAYDLYLQALPHFRGTDATSRQRAIDLLEAAVACDGTYALALAYAAWAHERQDTFGRGVSEAERQRALDLAGRALLADADDPLVQAISALVLLNLGGERIRSLAMLNRAVETCPHNATVLSLCAFANVMVGDVDAGRAAFLRALRIAPGALDNYELLVGVAIADIFSGEFEESAIWSMRSIAQNPDWLGAYWMLAAAHVGMRQIGAARATISDLLLKAPEMRMSDIERLGRRYADRFQLVIANLRSAGLPE
ncbi:MAG TPA: winged helix-turn-helix domain-containing protein [Devosia sp.]